MHTPHGSTNPMMRSAAPAGALSRLLALPTLALVGLFTLADLGAWSLHVLHVDGVLPSRFFRFGRDRGASEIIQYAKFGVVIWLLVAWHRVRPAPVLRAWIILFTVLLIDDSLGLHEWLSGFLVPESGGRGPFGLRSKDLAELVPLALLEGSALGYVLLQYLRAEPPLRRASERIALGLAPFVAAGFVLDLAPWPMAEQAGEVVAMTFLMAVVHALCRRRTEPEVP